MGRGFTSRKMKKAVWIQPEAVALIEFLEWVERSSPPCEIRQHTR